MEEQLFESNSSDQYLLSIICGLIALACAGFIFYLSRQPQKRETPIYQLLLGFGIMIALGTAFFSWLSTTKLDTVKITAQGIELPEGKVKWNKIDRAYLHFDQQLQPFSGLPKGDTTRFLMIIERGSGKTHVLSEEDYEIEKIGEAIREKMDEG